MVIDDHCYYTWGYSDRMRYSSLPCHGFQGVGVSRADFFTGPLEGWTAETLTSRRMISASPFAGNAASRCVCYRDMCRL